MISASTVPYCGNREEWGYAADEDVKAAACLGRNPCVNSQWYDLGREGGYILDQNVKAVACLGRNPCVNGQWYDLGWQGDIFQTGTRTGEHDRNVTTRGGRTVEGRERGTMPGNRTLSIRPV